MQVVVLSLILLIMPAYGRAESPTQDQWSYPAHTFPLASTQQAEPALAKGSRELRPAAERVQAEATTVMRTEPMLDEVTPYYDTEVEILSVDENNLYKTEELTDEFVIELPINAIEFEGNRDEVLQDYERNEKSLLNFPFHQQEITKHHKFKQGLEEASEMEVNERDTAILDEIQAAPLNSDGRKCIDKVMMREETEYDEVLTCDHSYDKRCHTSYVTKYHPHQEQDCEEKFRKVCTIEYEQKAVHEMVKVCITPFIRNCNVTGEEICKTVYESVCSTVQKKHRVEDDVANCRTEDKIKCMEVTEGFRTVEKCDTWPVEKCTLDKKLVDKFTPLTSCEKVGKEMCTHGCAITEGAVECQDKVKTVIVDNPVEECDMEPLRTCKHVTKLVPQLEPRQECVDVPKEICARSRVNPKRVKKPSIQKWCYTPEKETGPECENDHDCLRDTQICQQSQCVTGCRNNTQCSPGSICDGSSCRPGCDKDDDCPSQQDICEDSVCVAGCRNDEDCPSLEYCDERKCKFPLGKIPPESITIKTLSCVGCSEQTEGVVLSLKGQIVPNNKEGYPCTSSLGNPLNHQGVADFTSSGAVARFSGSTPAEREMMGDCLTAPLNGEIAGGTVTWEGEGDWTPDYVCVDWNSARNNYAYQCKLEKVRSKEWELKPCKKLADKDVVKCPELELGN
jgi:hypothetical protein